MRKMRALSLMSVALLCIGTLTAVGTAVDFVREVRPIFEKHCYECHRPEKRKTGYRLDVRASRYDFHAAILHLLGIDHERRSFYHNGIERRLTDVHGQVIRGLLA